MEKVANGCKKQRIQLTKIPTGGIGLQVNTNHRGAYANEESVVKIMKKNNREEKTKGTKRETEIQIKQKE